MYMACVREGHIVRSTFVFSVFASGSESKRQGDAKQRSPGKIGLRALALVFSDFLTTAAMGHGTMGWPN